MEDGTGVKAKVWLLLKVFGQEMDLPGHPRLCQPDQLCGQI